MRKLSIVLVLFLSLTCVKEAFCMGEVVPPKNLESQFGGLHARLHNFVISGMKWHRYDLPWQSVERKEGEFDFEEMDKAIDEMVNNGVSILGILEYTPCWAADKPEEHEGRECFNFPPKDLQDWENYIYQMVSHFKDRIKYWEIWNEPNIFFLNAPPSPFTASIISPAILADIVLSPLLRA